MAHDRPFLASGERSPIGLIPPIPLEDRGYCYSTVSITSPPTTLRESDRAKDEAPLPILSQGDHPEEVLAEACLLQNVISAYTTVRS